MQNAFLRHNTPGISETRLYSTTSSFWNDAFTQSNENSFFGDLFSSDSVNKIHTDGGVAQSQGSALEQFKRIQQQQQPSDVPPGSRAFVHCEREALIDLFHQYAINCDVSGRYLDRQRLAAILKAIGENTDPETVEQLFRTADVGKDGMIELEVRLHRSY